MGVREASQVPKTNSPQGHRGTEKTKELHLKRLGHRSPESQRINGLFGFPCVPVSLR